MTYNDDDGGLRGRAARLREGIGSDGALRLGLAAAVAWVVLVLGFWLLGGSADEAGGGRSGAGRLATIAGIILPLVLIWLAIGISRALSDLRAEAADLRAQLTAMQGGAALPAQPQRAEPAPRAKAAAASTPARAASAGRGARSPVRADAVASGSQSTAQTSPQTSLDLGAPAAVEIEPDDLIAALNFPDGPDDHATIAALRRALTDPETARLIRAAQDVVTLLAARGLYMDDLAPPAAPAETWRRFAEGLRGAGLSGLADRPGPLSGEGEAILAAALREDEVFRDAVHHFLRHWDRLISRAAPGLDDGQLIDLTATRSGRAFAALAYATGIFG